jgi:hypothetical protein
VQRLETWTSLAAPVRRHLPGVAHRALAGATVNSGAALVEPKDLAKYLLPIASMILQSESAVRRSSLRKCRAPVISERESR